MVIKLLALVAILFLTYVLFFKKNREKDIKKDNEDIMVECPTCNIYFSKKDGVLSNGKYFCSKECLLK